MENSTRRIVVIALLVLAIATLWFIIAHSMVGSASSWEESDAIAALFEPVLLRLYALAGKVTSLLGHPLALTYGVFVRKCAHFSEYALLGAECAAITVTLVGKPVSPYLWTDLFVVLAVGVIDEFVQSFTGRTSLVADVLIDFSGALAGMFIVLLIVLILMCLPTSSRRWPGKRSAL